MAKGLDFSEKQYEYIRDANSLWNFKIGATRCGKSYVDTAFVIPMRIRERAGKSGLNVILGVTKSTIERNVLQPMREIYGPEFVGEIGSDNIATIFGEDCYCLGAEKISQISKIRGASFKYVYGDEVADWNKDVFDILPSRLDKEYSCFDGSLNPKDVNHWLKLWINEQIKLGNSIYTQYYTIFDNPFLPDKVKESMVLTYSATPVLYDRYILGKWCNAEGLIYRAFANNNAKYKITKEELANKKLMYINIGHDFGGNLSNHAFVCTGITEDYELIALRSLSKPASGVDFPELFDTFKKFVQGCIDDFGIQVGARKEIDFIYCDSAEQTMINTYRKNTDYPIRNAIKGEINNRIRATNVILGMNKFYYLEGENDDLVDALNAASWSDKKDNTRLDNGTFNNDILDSFEYSWEYYSRKLCDFAESVA